MRENMIRKTSGTHRGSGTLALSVLIGASSLLAGLPEARADEVSPNGKGIVGGALLGGEVVTITESLIGVRNGWAYLIGGVVGAGGGGVGGYFVEHGTSNGQGAVYLLAGGMALIIPAVVLTLNATRYHPSESATEDRPPPGVAPADPGSVPTSPAPTPGTVTPAAAPPAGAPTSSATPRGVSPSASLAPSTSLVDVGLTSEETLLRLGLPVPEVRPMYSATEQRTYGLPDLTELRMSLFQLSF
jgi:hypothetical protein